MGNVLSPTTTTTTRTYGGASAKGGLSEADSQALTAFLRRFSAAPTTSSPFESMLWAYLHSNAEAENNSAQLLSELIDCSDKHSQANAVFRLGRLESTDLRTFVQGVCVSAIAEFWNQEPPKTVACDGVVEWLVLSKEPPNNRSIDAWRAWWGNNAMLHELLELALRSALRLEHSRVVVAGISEQNLRCPKLTRNNDFGKILDGESLLTADMGWAISRELPAHSRQSWHCAYSSRRDGRSWSTFQGAIENRGSILLLVSEKKRRKRVFGAYLDGEAVRLPSWHGTSQNFLFSADKDVGLSVYRTTGFNDHYQYLNYARETLPNGLGVGGQLGHFGFWIDCGFVSGSSSSTATYDSPQLSSQRDFAIGSIEAWVVRESADANGSSGEQAKKISAVAANPDAVALLEMANRPMYSVHEERS
ncbi:hypothetical protein IWW47_003094 [Coemansia sp. RSA 2052]|nr:hypothetical protein IWW47_003094 [Coemansia sp. RSA 2052]